MPRPLFRTLPQVLIAGIIISTLLAACQGSPTNSVSFAPNAPQAVSPEPYPVVCTVPKVKSGALVTSVAAFGSITKNVFTFAQPSSWMQVLWLKVLPPDAASRSPHTTARTPHTAAAFYYLYYGTYTVSDGTQGCLYVVTSTDGKPIDSTGNASLTAQPRIPPTGATLPRDFGIVGTLSLTLRANGTGSGSMKLLHSDGSKALSGKLTIVGRIDTSHG